MVVTTGAQTKDLVAESRVIVVDFWIAIREAGGPRNVFAFGDQKSKETRDVWRESLRDANRNAIFHAYPGFEGRRLPGCSRESREGNCAQTALASRILPARWLEACRIDPRSVAAEPGQAACFPCG